MFTKETAHCLSDDSMDKITSILLCLILSSVSFVSLICPRKRVKRIAFGEPLPSMHTYKTYYFVQIRASWACVSDQTDHEESITRCQYDFHRCGGTLIHPEFVLTAAHCIMYYEVILKYKGEGVDDWIRNQQDWSQYNRKYNYEAFEYWLKSLVVVPKPRHTVYSDWALLVGSNDWFKMTQKRHVTKVFPHKKFPTNLKSDLAKDLFRLHLNTYHDVALLRACQPFKIKSGEVEIAPMLNTIELLRDQFERIVRRGTTCLYIGFGGQDNNRSEVRQAGHPFYPPNLMLHTWRSSMCSSACNSYQLKEGADPHPCFLCSWHHGAKLGVVQSGDSGSPVTCDGKFVATVTKSNLFVAYNKTNAGSYPLHCIKHAITEDRLNVYRKAKNSDYHPLTRLRRFPLPPE